jgi:hypothetical protein
VTRAAGGALEVAMAIRKFKSLEDALLAGYTIDLGNGKYAQGGETISRDKYLGLLAALPKTPPEQHDETFLLPPMPRIQG